MTLAIAVLTGQRPELLEQTLRSFVKHHRHIWDDAYRCVLHNTGDPATEHILDGYSWHDRAVMYGRLLPIGEASQHLGRLVESSGAEYVMRLEDDWRAHPVDWWHDAVRLLQKADQVRLRRQSDKVASKCVTCRRPLGWQRYGRHRITKHAHYTHNPSLMRVDRFLSLFPYTNERDAGRKFHGQPVAQHVPGVFSHIGGGGLSLKRGAGGR